jgi:hypothetical protein
MTTRYSKMLSKKLLALNFLNFFHLVGYFVCFIYLCFLLLYKDQILFCNRVLYNFYVKVIVFTVLLGVTLRDVFKKRILTCHIMINPLLKDLNLKSITFIIGYFGFLSFAFRSLID